MTDKNPTVVHDIQDPLPEANWLWRRVLTYALCLAVLSIMAGCGYAMFRIVNSITGKIDAMDARAVVQITLAALGTVEQMFRLMFWALLVVVTYYMVAPSAEQITKMLQTAGLLKSGVQIAGRTVETPERRETASTVGKPPQPVSPPVEEPQNAAGKAPPEDETGSEATEVAKTPETASTALPDDMPEINASQRNLL